MAFRVLVLICFSTLLLPATSEDRPCEKVKNYDSASLGTLKTCYYMQSTMIDSKDFLISSDRDETVKGFRASSNKNVEYLPKNLGAKFPNLLYLGAGYCSVKEVSRKNFEGLDKLRQLWLHMNQIEKIDDDTFDGIPAVEEVHLDRNEIKKLNGRAFAFLHKLTRVDLAGNVCISENVDTAARIAEKFRFVSDRCGFIDDEPFVIKIAKLEGDLKAKSNELQAMKLENAKLEAKADSQIATIKEFHNEIKAQLKETCDARVELKVQEISHLSNELQAKTAEVNDKNEKIRQCEKKIQLLGSDDRL